MNFCSHCGHSVVWKYIELQGSNRHYCPSCNQIHYINPKIITGCLPYYEDKVLLCRRSIEPEYGKWNLPCGFLENGESIEHGARREAFEEAGIKPQIEKLLTVYNVLHCGQAYFIFLAKLPDLNFVCGQESLEVKFFTKENIPWDELAFSSNKFALKKYLSKQKSLTPFFASVDQNKPANKELKHIEGFYFPSLHP